MSSCFMNFKQIPQRTGSSLGLEEYPEGIPLLRLTSHNLKLSVFHVFSQSILSVCHSLGFPAASRCFLFNEEEQVIFVCLLLYSNYYDKTNQLFDRVDCSAVQKARTRVKTNTFYINNMFRRRNF